MSSPRVVEDAAPDYRDRIGVVTLGYELVERMLQLPEGYEIVTIWAEPHTRGIKILLRSEHLEPVAPGTEAPNLGWDGDIHLVACPPEQVKAAQATDDEDQDRPEDPGIYFRFELRLPDEENPA